MKRPLTALIVLFMLVPALAAVATGGGYGDYPTTTTHKDPCDEYHESRHPECQTTTTYQTTTTGQETTTTTEQTTTTQPEVTTTAQQTTTTVQECADGLIHQPPFCVEPTTTQPTPLAPTTLATTPAGEESLPFTGASTGMLALSAGAFLLLGLGALKVSKRVA